ncbi:MAG: Rrf2 family transcriptional regulator [Bdellovibrionota bacterium]
MNLTSRSRYALKIMLDLSHRRREPLVRRQEIVARQGIPSKYLDQILIRLRRSGLVESVRGRTGGYRIGRDIEQISMWEVFRAVEDGIYPVECVDEHHGCEFMQSCAAVEPWQIIFATLRGCLEGMTLADFESKFGGLQKPASVEGVKECRQGREPQRSTGELSEVL